MLPYVHRLRQQGYRCDVAYSFPEKYGEFRWLGWRGSQLVKRLVRHGHAAWAKWRAYDSIVIEREVFDSENFEIEQQLAALPAKLILDLDDGVFLRYPHKFSKVIPLCDEVIVGSRILEDAVRPLAQTTTVIPTVIDLDTHPFHPESQFPRPPRIGWIGTDSNVTYLSEILDVVCELQQSRNVPLRIITGRRESIEALKPSGCHIEFCRWSPQTATQDLSTCTIGIMPLPNDEWQQYKCGCKLLQYLAIGIPSVASQVGVNQEILEPGVNGFLCQTPADWHRHLTNLLDNEFQRHQFAAAGRRTVEAGYALDVHVDRFREVVFPSR